MLNNILIIFNNLILFLKSISPEIIAGVFIFIISERFRFYQENKRRFKELRMNLIVYIDSFVDIIVSEKLTDANREKLNLISRNIREKYSEIEGFVVMLNKKDRKKWEENFKIIREDIKIFALINTIGDFSSMRYGIDRSEQIEKLKELLKKN